MQRKRDCEMLYKNKLYKNPILPGFNPDPSICKVDEDYYIVTSSFEFYPGVPIYHSRNLVNWELIGYCLTRKSQLDLENTQSSGGIFAPTLYHHNDFFFLATTDINKGNFIVYAENIYGPWSDPVWIDQRGIDPSLLFDEDGTVYFLSADNDGEVCSILMCTINIFTGEKLSKTHIINSGCGGRYPEGPHLYKIFGKYYLMLAEGGTEYGHMETIQRADSPYGPYEKCPHNPVLTHRNDMKGEICGVGHADIVEDGNGNWWAVCLGFRPSSPQNEHLMLHHLGRETYLCPIKWDERQWPVMGDNGKLSLYMTGDLPGLPENNIKLEYLDSFRTEQLDIHYNFLRNPIMENYRIDAKAGRLVLQGTEITINDGRNPTWIGIRQPEFKIDFSVTVGIEELKYDGRIGITAFYNESYHYDMYLQKRGKKLKLYLEKHVHDMFSITHVKEIKETESGEIRLAIKSDKKWYRFLYADKAGGMFELGKGLVAGLATEGTRTMTFTGTYLAMFAERGRGYFKELNVKVSDADKEDDR
mgnify:FL=1